MHFPLGRGRIYIIYLVRGKCTFIYVRKLNFKKVHFPLGRRKCIGENAPFPKVRVVYFIQISRPSKSKRSLVPRKNKINFKIVLFLFLASIKM